MVWPEATGPPEWTHGAARPPWTRGQVGDELAPWLRRTSIRSAGPVARQAIASVRPRRVDPEESHDRNVLSRALAKVGMDGPFEILRPGPVTLSVAHSRPAVSSTIARSRSTTRKLLS